MVATEFMGERMKRALVAVAVLVSCISHPVLADECAGCPVSVTFGPSDWSPSYYAGAGYVQSMFEDWDASSHIDSASYTSRSEDDGDAGFRVFAGMDFLQHFGVELAYADFGEATFSGQTDGTGVVFAPGTQRDSVKLDGYFLHVIARVPVARDFLLAGRAGFAFLEARQRQSGTAYAPGPTPYDVSDSNRSTRFSWGMGLNYDGFKPVRVALAYEAATFEAPATDALVGASDIRSLNLSLAYSF